VNASFSDGNAMKDGNGFLLYPIGESADINELFDLRKSPSMFVLMLVSMCVFVLMLMGMCVFMFVRMGMAVSMLMRVGVRMGVPVLLVVMRKVHIKFNTGDAALGLARDMEVIAIQFQLGQFLLQALEIQSQVEQRADKHVAADTAIQIEEKSGHRSFTAN
jgi:hypothetical protein